MSGYPGSIQGDGNGGTFYEDAAPLNEGPLPHILVSDWTKMLGGEFVCAITPSAPAAPIVLNRTQARYLRDWLTERLGE